MSDNENKKCMEALPDEALDTVTGGMDLAAFCGCICADCGLTDMSVHDYYLLDDGSRLGIKLCPAHAAQRRQKGQVLQELGV